MLAGQTSLEDDDTDCSDDQPFSINNVPEISLHAMTGAPTPQTMRVKRLLGCHAISILIDIVSTHNFLHPHLAKKASLLVDTKDKLDVIMASGDKLPRTGRCQKTGLTIQGTLIYVDFYLLPLGDCDAVLGA